MGPRQNGLHFVYDIFKCIASNENDDYVWISPNIQLKFIPSGSFKNIIGSDDGLAPNRRQAII